jgi:hypothetical protein
LGQQSGEAALVNWNWYYAAPEFAVWLVLIAGLALPKSNRNIKALAIFLPIGISSLLWAILIKITSAPSSIQGSGLFQSMLVGIALLWLLGDYIGKFGGAGRFMLFLAVMVGTGIICYLSYSPGSLEAVIEFLILYVCLVVTLLTAMTLTRLSCKKTYSQKRFMLYLALCMLLTGSFGLVIFVIIGNVIFTSWPSNLISEFLSVAGIGLIFGLVVYVFNLPFMILGFVNPFYRERFLTCMRLKQAIANVDSGGQDMPAEDKNGTVCN